MNLAEVMDELAQAIEAVPQLQGRTYAYPPDAITPPAAIVSYPDTIVFDEAYARGMDRMTMNVWVYEGKVSDRAVKDRLGAYCNGSGPSSIKAAIEAHDYTTCDSVRVASIEFDTTAFIAGVDHISAVFEVDVAGQGTTT